MINLKYELQHFIGTEQYYKHPLSGLVYTDGIQYMASHAGAYWLVDHILLNGKQYMVRDGFVCAKLHVENTKGWITLEDGNGNIYEKQDLDYTDFPAGDWNFFLSNGVLMVPSEW